MKLRQSLKTFGRDASGATAVEYGLILSLVFLAIAGAVQSLASVTTGMWNDVSEKVETADD